MRVVAFLFALLAVQCWAADKPKIVFVAGEFEYLSRETLPKFAEDLAKTKDAEIVVLKRPEDATQQTIPGAGNTQGRGLVSDVCATNDLARKRAETVSRLRRHGEAVGRAANVESCVRELEGVR